MTGIVSERLSAALEQLKSESSARHKIPIGTPEYLEALEREVRIATEIRRLAESGRLESEQPD
jgi:hypothetical protein